MPSATKADRPAEPGAALLRQDRIGTDEIPPAHVRWRDGLGLVAVGKILQTLEGCACPMGVLSREFLKRLSLTEDEAAVVDMEAGIEHFGRGVETSVDAVIAVVECSLESARLAARIRQLTTAGGARFAGAVLNKLPDEPTARRLSSELDAAGVEVLGSVRHLPEIAEAALAGTALIGAGLSGEVAAVVDALTPPADPAGS